MGQQQLLLIVLGVIIVGIAIVVGINLFQAQSVNANRDAVYADLNNLGAMAQGFYRKPTSMGGGSNTFTGFVATLPANLKTTDNGTYAFTEAAQSVTIVGVGAGGTGVSLTATVSPTAISIVVTP
ncbi:MAG: hypothetical protein K8H86_13745 [Ignavibacteriaceae bacterium]|nr:hypothetical protein [Ignavibacteriaceae bacterium]